MRFFVLLGESNVYHCFDMWRKGIIFSLITYTNFQLRFYWCISYLRRQTCSVYLQGLLQPMSFFYIPISVYHAHLRKLHGEINPAVSDVIFLLIIIMAYICTMDVHSEGSFSYLCANWQSVFKIESKSANYILLICYTETSKSNRLLWYWKKKSIEQIKNYLL
jgi:hypothetical protein